MSARRSADHAQQDKGVLEAERQELSQRTAALKERVDTLRGLEDELTRLTEQMEAERRESRETAGALENQLIAEQGARAEERETWRLRVAALDERLRQTESVSEDKTSDLLSKMHALSLLKGEAEGRAEEQLRQMRHHEEDMRQLRRRLQEAEKEAISARAAADAASAQIGHLNATVKKQREALVEAEQALYGAQSPRDASGSIMI